VSHWDVCCHSASNKIVSTELWSKWITFVKMEQKGIAIGTLVCEPRACPECKRRRVKCSLGVRPCHNCADKPELRAECLADGAIHKRTCMPCKQLRKQCDRKNPCTRCVKKGIECVPSWTAKNTDVTPVLAQVVDYSNVKGHIPAIPAHLPPLEAPNRSNQAPQPPNSFVYKVDESSHPQNQVQSNANQAGSAGHSMDVTTYPFVLNNSQSGGDSLFNFLHQLAHTTEVDQDYVMHEDEFLDSNMGPELVDEDTMEVLKEEVHSEHNSLNSYTPRIDQHSPFTQQHSFLSEDPQFWNTPKLFEITKEQLFNESPMAILDALQLPFGRLFFYFLCFNQVFPPHQVYDIFRLMFDVVGNSLPLLSTNQRALLDKRVHLLQYQNMCLSDANRKNINPVGTCVVSLKVPKFTTQEMHQVSLQVADFQRVWSQTFPGYPIPANPGIIISKLDPITGEFLTFWDEISEEVFGCRFEEEIEVLTQRERRDREWVANHQMEVQGPLKTGTYVYALVVIGSILLTLCFCSVSWMMISSPKQSNVYVLHCVTQTELFMVMSSSNTSQGKELNVCTIVCIFSMMLQIASKCVFPYVILSQQILSLLHR
jgi:hypothetical protein